MIKNCLVCGKEFKVNYFRRKSAKYCSRKCYDKSERSGVTRKKMSEAQRGEKNYFYNKHYRGKKHPRYGKYHSEETKRKISIAHKGKKLSEETRRKISEANKGINNYFYGKHLPEKTRKLMRLHHYNTNGFNNPRWKGGKIADGHGYMLIYSPQHPFKNVGKYIYEHRLIMEKHLGRYLKPQEVVHHINSNTLDNKIGNLMLFPNISAHFKFHREMRQSS